MNELITRIKDKNNCPNCGAPLEGERCEYCGTLFVDFACLKTDEPFYIKFKNERGLIHMARVILASCEFTSGQDTMYYDNTPYFNSIWFTPRKINVEFELLDLE